MYGFFERRLYYRRACGLPLGGLPLEAPFIPIALQGIELVDSRRQATSTLGSVIFAGENFTSECSRGEKGDPAEPFGPSVRLHARKSLLRALPLGIRQHPKSG
jgi:hypothetical protein